MPTRLRYIRVSISKVLIPSWGIKIVFLPFAGIPEQEGRKIGKEKEKRKEEKKKEKRKEETAKKRGRKERGRKRAQNKIKCNKAHPFQENQIFK